MHKASQTRILLWIGFGGLVFLLVVAGLNALSILNKLQNRNESIRQDYVNRSRILEQLRSDLFLSGTYVRDLLLEPDPALARVHRNELDGVRAQIYQLIDDYKHILRPEEKQPFSQFEAEVDSYLNSLKPALIWTAKQRQQLGYAFMKESLLPRRMSIVHMADQLASVNERQMEAASRRVNNLFSSSRRWLAILFFVTLACGILLAGMTMRRLFRLERESAQRFEEVVQARSALSDLSARLLEVQETERRALSRELHDEVGQSLSALLLALGNVAALIPADGNSGARAQLQDIRRMAEKTVAVVRDMSLLLRPSMLDDLGLIPALKWQAREVSRTSNLAVEVHAGSIPEDLPDEHKTCIYRVVQEALRNVTRHARAKHVQISLEQSGTSLHLMIQDDGQGFVPEKDKGVGLLGMQERVARLHGTFAIQSEPGKGATIQVSLPLPLSA
jgi:signal transduction histidine kinase